MQETDHCGPGRICCIPVSRAPSLQQRQAEVLPLATRTNDDDRAVPRRDDNGDSRKLRAL
jgi:hypothetical protein